MVYLGTIVHATTVSEGFAYWLQLQFICAAQTNGSSVKVSSAPSSARDAALPSWAPATQQNYQSIICTRFLIQLP